MTKTNVAPFYLGHGVVTLLIADLPRLGAATPAGLADRPSALRSVCLHSGIFKNVIFGNDDLYRHKNQQKSWK